MSAIPPSLPFRKSAHGNIAITICGPAYRRVGAERQNLSTSWLQDLLPQGAKGNGDIRRPWVKRERDGQAGGYNVQ